MHGKISLNEITTLGTKLLGLRYQGASSKIVYGEYLVRFSGEQRIASVYTSTHESD